VLLTRRTQKVKHHKGEISFPGGHKDPGDADLVETALREAEEEVGIAGSEVRVLGRLDDISTITGFRIRPFVGVIPYPFEARLDRRETAEVFTLPLYRFLEPDGFRLAEFTKDGVPYPVYYFSIDGYNVWGATAKIMVQFLELVMDFRDPSK
jgi:8-oxo-dGTP pyrophosphatase MutT (NUDIX family)